MVSLTQLISQESITLLDAADLTSQVCTALISGTDVRTVMQSILVKRQEILGTSQLNEHRRKKACKFHLLYPGGLWVPVYPNTLKMEITSSTGPV